jgi:hypothetical protein
VWWSTTKHRPSFRCMEHEQHHEMVSSNLSQAHYSVVASNLSVVPSQHYALLCGDFFMFQALV